MNIFFYKVHSGEKPYICGICGKTAATRSNYNSHLRTHITRWATEHLMRQQRNVNRSTDDVFFLTWPKTCINFYLINLLIIIYCREPVNSEV